MRITYGELVATQAKIEKINLRAAKKGFTGRLAVESERVVVKSKNALGFEIEEIFYETTVTGDAPSYNGWTIAATLDWDAEAGLIVRTAPGVDKVDRSKLVQGHCDHCKKIRLRTKSYLVRNVDGDQRQVGSTCIKDFLGWSGNVVFYSTDEVQDEVDHLLAGGGYYERRWTVETVFAVAWAAIRAFGFVPASSYDGTPTKSTVLTVLDPGRSKQAQELSARIMEFVPQAAAQAKVIRDWVLSDAFSGDTEYVHNLKAIAAADTVNARNVGLLASAPQAWARAQERDLIRRQEKAELVNEFVGQEKDRLELTVRIKSIRYTAGDFGTTTIYTLVCTEGQYANHVFKWFSSNEGLGDVVDTVHKVKGTVKKHDEYQGNKSTVLTRVKKI